MALGWRTAPDGFHIAVPLTWNVPTATEISTSPNKNLSEGELRWTPATVADLVVSGPELSDVLFRAQGLTSKGATNGVSIGVYEIGASGSPASLKDEISRTAPEVRIREVTVAAADGLQVTWPAPKSNSKDRAVTSDYWVEVPNRPGRVVLVRFWHQGEGDEELMSTQEFMAGAFSFILPSNWSGAQRRLNLRGYRPPTEEAPEKGLWRLAGWRLGRVFHTAPLGERFADSLSTSSIRPLDRILLLLVFFVWLGTVLALIGAEGILLLGGIAFGVAVLSARRLRWRAAAALLVVLSVLLGIGIAAYSSPT